MFGEAETFESFETRVIRGIRLYTMVGAEGQDGGVEQAGNAQRFPGLRGEHVFTAGRKVTSSRGTYVAKASRWGSTWYNPGVSPCD